MNQINSQRSEHASRVRRCPKNFLEKRTKQRKLRFRSIAKSTTEPVGAERHRWEARRVDERERVNQSTFMKDIAPAISPSAGIGDVKPAAMHTKLHQMLKGAMRGRTMFVVPYIMGPPDSPLTKVGFEITDSIYVVLSMRIMTRMGDVAIQRLGDDPTVEWNRGVHSLLDVDPMRRFICHFPQDNAIISVGSGYGGNVLLRQKCLPLLPRFRLARQPRRVAAHQLL